MICACAVPDAASTPNAATVASSRVFIRISLTLASRLQAYRPSLFDRLLERERRLFEHWTHDASAVPPIWYPHWRFRFERYARKVREHPWWKERIGPHPDDLIDRVRERLVREGPLMTRDFEDTRGNLDGGADRTWWGWKPEAVAGRSGCPAA